MSRYAVKVIKTATTHLMPYAIHIAPYSTSVAAHIASIKPTVVVPSQSAKHLSTATNSLMEERYEDAAKDYTQWLKEEGILDQIAEHSFDPATRKEAKHLPNVLRAFLGCPCDDGCKDHIMGIAREVAKMPTSRGNTALHIIAASGSEGNDQAYRALIDILLSNEEQIANAVAAKNSLGQNFIDVAVLNKNVKFVEALKDEGKLPVSLPMDNIGFYKAVEDEGADLTVYDLLGVHHHDGTVMMA
jgi:hypothetical protein